MSTSPQNLFLTVLDLEISPGQPDNFLVIEGFILLSVRPSVGLLIDFCMPVSKKVLDLGHGD